MVGEKEEFVLDGHTSSCLTAEMQPSGRYLATGGSDSIISLWDTTDWICQRTVTKMVGPVKSLSTFPLRFYMLLSVYRLAVCSNRGD